MKQNERATRDQIKAMLHRDLETLEVPARLQPDAVADLLRETAPEAEPENLIVLPRVDRTASVRRALAVAAMIALIVTGALFFRSHSEHQLKRAESGNYSLIKNADSYEELDRAVRDILEKDQTSDAAKKEAQTVPGTKKEPATAATSGRGETLANALLDAGLKLLEGFVSVPAEAPSPVAPASNAADAAVSDIVKSSGDYLFLVTPGINPATGAATEQIRIVRAAPAGQMQIAATVLLADGGSADTVEECFDLFVSGKRMVALLHRYSYALKDSGAVDQTETVAVFFDISDPAAPKRLSTAVQDGNYVFSDLQNGKLRLGTCKALNGVSAAAGGDLPQLTVDGAAFRPKPGDVCMAINDPEASYLFITELPLAAPYRPASALAVLGCGSRVTAAQNGIYVVRTFAQASDENAAPACTAVYRFVLDEQAVRFAGAFLADGALISSLSVADDGGVRFVARRDDTAELYCLNGAMECTDSMKLQPGGDPAERAFFAANRCYALNAKKIIIADLTDSGRLKATTVAASFSQTPQFYALSATQMVGLSADANGEIQLTPVDLTDPDAPVIGAPYQLTGVLGLPGEDGEPNVMVLEDRALFGLPVIKRNAANGSEISCYLLFSVSDGSIRPVGTYNHSANYTGDAAAHGAVIGDVFYTISGEKICAFALSGGKLVGSLTF